MQQHPCHHHAKALGREVAMVKVGSLPAIAACKHRHTVSENIVSHAWGLHVWMTLFQLHFYPFSCIFWLLLVCTNTALQDNAGPCSTLTLCGGVHLRTAWLLSLPWNWKQGWYQPLGMLSTSPAVPHVTQVPLFTEG